jgi:methylglutaconyl-CoA hydratase
MTDAILLDLARRVATITLNRPQLHNAFDDALVASLTAALRGVDEDPQVRCIVLAANGRSFSAGADLAWMARMADYTEAQNLADARALAELMRVLDAMRKPTIARVQGPAYGGGVGLVACCDIAVATPAASFMFSEARLGIVPAVISPYCIRAIGARAARRYFLSAERFDAATAARLGLVHAVVEAEALDSAIAALIEALLQAGPQAQAECKSLIAEVQARPLDPALIDSTARRIATLRASPEGRTGIRAFLDKQAPPWRE